MIETVSHRLIDTNPASPVNNRQEPGIGRLVADNGWLFINNLGRNIECRRLNGELKSDAQIYADTIYENGSLDSEFDLDFHAFLVSSDSHLWAVNHYGVVRQFALAKNGGSGSLSPLQTWRWPGDMSCIVRVGSSLIGSSPAGYQCSDAAQPGLFISTNMDLYPGARPGEEGPAPLPYTVALPDWGSISSLAVDRTGTLLSVAAGDTLAVFVLAPGEQGSPTVERQLWSRRTGFAPIWLKFRGVGPNAILFASGYDLAGSSAQETDWDGLCGGGWMSLQGVDGEILARHPLTVDLAWGNGGVPLCLSASGATLYGCDRAGGLHSFDCESGEEQLVAEAECHSGLFISENSSKPTAVPGLGMAHLTSAEGTLYCGYNRGGYKLHIFGQGQIL